MRARGPIGTDDAALPRRGHDAWTEKRVSTVDKTATVEGVVEFNGP